MKNLLLFLLLALTADCFAQVTGSNVSSVYVGGHIRRERPSTITKLRNSGFTTAILFNVDVEPDGTLKTDGETICQNGEYVFAKTQPYYITDIQNLKKSPTTISRIEICIGGWGNQSYSRIKDILNAASTVEETMLYKNFKALKDVLPEIDAVNNDDEHCYDYPTALKFHKMMFDLGYTTTLAPYTNKSFWKNLAQGLNRYKALDRILIQCYDGGAGNNPADWHLVSGIPVHGGRMYYQDTWDVAYHIGCFQQWADECDVTGGFVWVYNDESWDMNAWATGINRVYKARQVSSDLVAATVFSEENHGGYAIALPEGTYKQVDFALWGINKSDIASLKIAEGYTVTLYTNSSCGGRGQTYDSDQASLGNYTNRVNSLKIEAIDTGIAQTECNSNEEWFAPDGLRLAAPRHGINILRTADGRTRTFFKQ